MTANAKQNARENGRIILAHGEATGHHHQVYTPSTDLPPSMDVAQFFTEPGTNRKILAA